MKKFVFGGIAVLVIAVMAAFNVDYYSRYNLKTIVSSSGIEVLAQEVSVVRPTQETPWYCTATYPCSDGRTTATCRGYNECGYDSVWFYVECDGVRSYC